MVHTDGQQFLYEGSARAQSVWKKRTDSTDHGLTSFLSRKLGNESDLRLFYLSVSRNEQKLSQESRESLGSRRQTAQCALLADREREGFFQQLTKNHDSFGGELLVPTAL